VLRKAIRWWNFTRPYRARFGTLAGLRVGSAMADAGYRRPPGAEVWLSIPEWRAPLVLRAQGSDPDVFRQVVVQRELEFPIAQAPRTILDAGANIGISVRVFAERWPDASIVAIELEAENAALLRRNCAAYEKVTVLQGGLWSGKGWLHLADSAAGASTFSAVEQVSGGDGAIPSFGVADLLDDAGWETVDLLKLDIEGGEIAVFRAADRWLHRCRRIVVELHDRFAPGCTDAVHAVLSKAEWTMTEHGEYLLAERKSWPVEVGRR
jgi:FkbM family methyltransferase